MRKGAKCAECLFFGFPIVFYIGAFYGIIVQMIAISINYQSKVIYSNIIHKINDNIRAEPVYDVFATNGTNCPGGERFDIGSWIGTHYGCYNTQNHTLLKSTCHEHHINVTDKEWIDVPPEPTRLYIKWRDVILCKKKIQGYTLLHDTNATCPSGHRLCNIRYCVPSHFGCFVTSLRLNHDLETGATGISVLKDYNSPAIFNVKMSQGGSPCFDPNKSPKTDNPYLLKVAGSGCDPFGEDNLTTILDKNSEYSTMLSNGMDSVIKKLPNYEEYSKNQQLYLYYSIQPNVSWSLGCQHLNLTDLALKVLNFQMPYVSINLIAYSIVGLIFVISTVIFICVDKEEADRERFERDQKCLYHTFHCLPYLMGILFISEANAIPKDEKTPLHGLTLSINSFLEQNCFHDEIYNQFMIDMKQYFINNARSIYHPTRMLEMFSWACIVLLLLIRGYRAYYRRDIEVFENEYLENRYHRQDLSRAEQQDQHQDFEEEDNHQ